MLEWLDWRSVWVVASLVVVGAIVGADAAEAQAGPIDGIEVTVAYPDQGVFQGGIFAVTYEFRNVGLEQYTDVTVEVHDACGPSQNAGLVVFDEAIGNGDDVFGPDEVWRYLAPKCIDWAVPFAGTTIWATESAGDRIRGVYYGDEYVRLLPVSVTPVGGVTVSCDAARFSVSITNLTNSSLTIEQVVLHPWGDLDRETIRATNGDEFFDPNETWELVVNDPLQCDRSYNGSSATSPPDPPIALQLEAEGWTLDYPTFEPAAPWCFGQSRQLSCAFGPVDGVAVGTVVGIIYPTSTTTSSTTTSAPGRDVLSSTLPPTGSDGTGRPIGMLATALLLSGSLALGSARFRKAPGEVTGIHEARWAPASRARRRS